ncbi:MAG: hypothetical protein GXP54_10185 [Deltaproteobacteria bacterium]|nr:hypothetical protein [Deltaproteobacteria bacterium]
MVQSVLFSPVAPKLACSSLGFHAAYQGLGSSEWAAMPEKGGQPRSSVTDRVLSEFDCVYVSVSWELELPVLVHALRRCGIEPRRALRPPSDSLIIAGGPQTQSNPDALAAICDAVFVGDADHDFETISECLDSSLDRGEALAGLSQIDGMWVPSVHGDGMPETRLDCGPSGQDRPGR